MSYSAESDFADRFVRLRVDFTTESGEIRFRHSSGFIVAAGVILTSAHGLQGAQTITVGSGEHAPLKLLAGPDVVRCGSPSGPSRSEAPDLALICDARIGPGIPRFRVARLDRSESDLVTLRDVAIVGYPAFKEGGRRIRFHGSGTVSLLSSWESGLIDLQLSVAPPELLPGDPLSQWAGISGAPLIVDEFVIGVVTEHPTRMGRSTLSATPLTLVDAIEAHRDWGPGVTNPEQWWRALGVVDNVAPRIPGPTVPVPTWCRELSAMEEACSAASTGLADPMSQASVFAVQAHDVLIESLRRGGDQIQFQREVQRRLRAPACSHGPTVFGVCIVDAFDRVRLFELLNQLIVVLELADTQLTSPGSFRFRLSATRLDEDALAQLVQEWLDDRSEDSQNRGDRIRLARLLDVGAHEDTYGELLARLSNSEWCSLDPLEAANTLIMALLSKDPAGALRQAIDRCVAEEPVVLATMLTTDDKEPDAVVRDPEGFLVNEQPRLDHLRDGYFAPSLDLDVVEADFWSWLEHEVLTSSRQTSRRVPMFWLVGPSGSGKSILLLQLLARLRVYAGVSVLLHDRQPERLPSVARRARRLSSRRLTIVGVDDPLTFSFGGQESTWSETFSVLRGSGPIIPGRGLVIFVGTATTEQLEIFRQRVAGEVQVSTHVLQPYRSAFVDHLRDWYQRRTDRNISIAPDSEAIRLPAQLFFEWWKGEGILEFANRFRNRIFSYGLPELAAFFYRLLAANRLYVGIPPGVLDRLSAHARDAIRTLVQDMHLSQNPIGRPGFWLSHPQLANAVYECWFPAGLYGEQRADHLASALTDAIHVHPEGWGSIPLLARLLGQGPRGDTLGARLESAERRKALREAGASARAARAELALPVLAAWINVDHQCPGLLSWRPAEEAVDRLRVAAPFDLGVSSLMSALEGANDEAGIAASWEFLTAHSDWYGWIGIVTQLVNHPMAEEHAELVCSFIADRLDEPAAYGLLIRALGCPFPPPSLTRIARDFVGDIPDRNGQPELAAKLYALGGDNRAAALAWLGRNVRQANGAILHDIMMRTQPVLTVWDAMSRWLEAYPLEPESDLGFAAVTNWSRWEGRTEIVNGTRVFPFRTSLARHLHDRDTRVSEDLMSTIQSMLTNLHHRGWSWLYCELTLAQARRPEMYALAVLWLRRNRSSNAWHHVFSHLCAAFTDEPRGELAAVGRDQVNRVWTFPHCARLLEWILHNALASDRHTDAGRALTWLTANEDRPSEWGYLLPAVLMASEGPVRRAALDCGLAWWRGHDNVGPPASYVLRALLHTTIEECEADRIGVVVAEAVRWLQDMHDGWGHVFLDLQPLLSESDCIRLALPFLYAEVANDRWTAVLDSSMDKLEPVQIKQFATMWFDRGISVDSTAGFIWAVAVEQDRCPDILVDQEFRRAVLRWLESHGSLRSWWHIWRAIYVSNPLDASALRSALSAEVDLQRSYGIANLVKRQVIANPELAPLIWSLLEEAERGQVWSVVWMTMSLIAPSDVGWDMGYEYLLSAPDEYFGAWWRRLWNLADNDGRRRLRPLGRSWLSAHDDSRIEMKLEEEEQTKITPGSVFGRRKEPTFAAINARFPWTGRPMPNTPNAVQAGATPSPTPLGIQCPHCLSVVLSAMRQTSASSSRVVCLGCGGWLDVDASREVTLRGFLPRHASTPISLRPADEVGAARAVIHCSCCRRDLATLASVVGRQVAIDFTCDCVYEVPLGLLGAFWPDHTP